jgi:hypothetical protein
VIWWGRRAFYEVVEELSSALWWSVWLSLIVGHIALEAPKWITWQSTLAIGMIYLYIWYEALIEIEIWRNEIFAVGFDPQTGEGRIYKFFVPVGKSKNRLLTKPWNVFSRADFDDQITLNSPAPQTDEWWWYRLWGWLTNERMMRLKLTSIVNTYVEGQRVSPELLRAIKYVRSTQPKKQEQSKDPTSYLLHEIRLAKLSGDLTPEKAQMYTLELLERIIYGI